MRVGPITLPIPAAQELDPVDGRGAGARLELWSSLDEDGSYTLVTFETLVAGTEVIYFNDAAGTTDTWYQSRITRSDGSDPSEFSPAVQAGTVDAYATLAEFKQTIKTVSDGNDSALVGYLVDASRWLDMKCGRRFYRAPGVSGTETRTFRIRNASGSLSAAVGAAVDIVSVTSVEFADYTGGSYTTLDATDWVLLDPDYEGFPSAGLVLSDVGTYRTFPRGFATVRITGVFGFSAVPDLIRRATIEVAREMHRQGPGGASAAQAGVNQFNVPIFLTGYPPTVRSVIDATSPFLNRSWAWV